MKLLRNCALVAAAALAVAAAPVHAESKNALGVDSVSFEVGVGEHVQLYRAGMQWDWNRDWFSNGSSHLNGYFDLNLGWWHGTRYKDRNDNQNLGVIGFTPVFRWESVDKKGFYAEAGIGVSFFSECYNNNDNKMGSSFQFADHIGVGYVFKNNFDLGLRVQHYSNAGIAQPNDGENFVVLRGAYRF